MRGAVENLLPDPRFAEAQFVGGRGAESSGAVDFVGAIKWRDNTAFNRHDLSRLIEHRAAVPGATPDARLVGVSRSGFSAEGLDVHLDPHEAFPA